MTSLVSWIGVDHRAPSSIYIATDSRVSWGQESTWDAGRKVFASRSRPEVFGYVGDVLFPSLVLGQIADASESPNPAIIISSEQRFERISRLIKETFESLPSSEKRSFQIAYALRIGDGMDACFRFYSLSWDKVKGWIAFQEKLPAKSDSVVIWGSGTRSINLWKERWSKSSQCSTSRAIFSSLCDAISSEGDPLSGGAPQLVGLYRIGPARTIGVIHEGRPYVFGLPAEPADHAVAGLEWRNRIFERCNVSGKRIESAKSHHVPKGLGGSTKIGSR